MYKKFLVYRIGKYYTNDRITNKLDCKGEEMSNKKQAQLIQSTPLKSLHKIIQTEKIKISDYRKYLSIRTSVNDNQNLQITPSDITTIKFDYIISLLDNKYEEIKYKNEDDFCTEEQLNIFLTYINKTLSLEKAQDSFFIYINKMTSYNLAYTNSPNGLPNPEDKPKFLKLLEDLFNQIVSNTNDKFTYSIKLITKTNSSNDLCVSFCFCRFAIVLI